MKGGSILLIPNSPVTSQACKQAFLMPARSKGLSRLFGTSAFAAVSSRLWLPCLTAVESVGSVPEALTAPRTPKPPTAHTLALPQIDQTQTNSTHTRQDSSKDAFAIASRYPLLLTQLQFSPRTRGEASASHWLWRCTKLPHALALITEIRPIADIDCIHGRLSPNRPSQIDRRHA